MDTKTQTRPEPPQNPYSAVYKASPSVLPPFIWTGVYLGGHIGWGWEVATLNDPFTDCANFTCVTGDPIRNINLRGSLGGAQLGWNYQVNNLVVGGEIDFSSSGVNGTRSDNLAATGTIVAQITTANETREWSDTVNWLATATARLGYAWDNFLLYTKGGIAVARNTYGLFDTNVSTFNFCCISSTTSTTALTGSDTRTGLTVGVGAEWAFWKNWSATAEYDYADLGNGPVKMSGTITSVSSPGGTPFTTSTILALSIDERIQIIKLGLNYRFQWAPDAVAVNY